MTKPPIAAIFGTPSEASTPSSTPARALIFAAAAWSGFFVMGIELLGGRFLAPYFGSSIFVWGGILAVFMSCLSIGYLWGGRMSMKSPSLQGLGLLLFWEAVCAMPITSVGDWVLEDLSYTITDPRYGSLLGALLLFGASTVVSGMISPYAIRLLVTDTASAGRSAGALYFSSTIGSAAGTLVTSFYLVLILQIDTIVRALAATSAAVGIILWGVGMRCQRRTAQTSVDCSASVPAISPAGRISIETETTA